MGAGNGVELMSPVGSMESLHAAIQGGADAIYFGIGRLNMRSRSSKNLSEEQLRTISDICIGKGINTYLTLNTVIYDSELDEVKDVLALANECGITAIIASDIAVLESARKIGLRVHISTQCNITNLEAVRFYSRYGDVMVAARELSLEQLKYLIAGIQQQNISGPSGELVKIEIFAHGAMCMAVSGKCYLSQDLECHSANRGACLQLCRRSYTLTDKESGQELFLDQGYILSPKDLCTIGYLDKILEAGVRVLKIEGRGRSADYVKTVTTCYRQAIDAWTNNCFSGSDIEKWTKQLRKVYNRGFWEGYYLGKTTLEWTESYGSQATHIKVYVGKVTNYYGRIGVAEILPEADIIKTGDEILITGETTGVVEDVVREMRIDANTIIQEAVQGKVFSIPIREMVRRGDKLYRIDKVSR